MIGDAYERYSLDMPRFYGFGLCYVEKNNPKHPDLEEIREKVEVSEKEWKCAKWTREEGPLPLGPKSVKK